MKNTKGFTLVELAIVVLIIGILAGLAGPNLFNMLKDSRAKSDIRAIYSALNLSKMSAIKENQRTVMVLSIVNQQYTAFVNRCGNDWALDACDTILETGSITQGATLSTNLVANTMGWTSTATPDFGAGQASPATVTVQSETGRFFRVRIGVSGTMATEKSSDGITWN